MLLQETHVTDAAEANWWFSSSGFLTVTIPGTAHSRGQVLLYRLSFSFVDSWVELEGRFLITEFSRRNSLSRIASIYAPNRNPERDDFTSCLGVADPSVPMILCGGFNANLKEPKIVGALILLSPSVRALSHWSYFSRSFVFWMFGAISILIFALTPGWNPMVPCPPGSTLLASRLSAFILCLPVLLFHVLSLITMPFFSSSLFLNCFLVALADGNWMFPSSGILSFFQFFSGFWLRWRSRKPSFSTLQHWWDRGKEHLKSLAVRHCSGAHNERYLSRSVLSSLASHLKGRIEYFGPSPYYYLTWFYNWPIHWRAFFRPQFYQFLTLQFNGNCFIDTVKLIGTIWDPYYLKIPRTAFSSMITLIKTRLVGGTYYSLQ